MEKTKKIYGLLSHISPSEFNTPNLIIFNNEQQAKEWQAAKTSDFFKKELCYREQAIKMYSEKAVKHLEKIIKKQSENIIIFQ